MSTQLLGQFDPEMTGYMNETMALYRHVFQTANRWTFLIDGTARAGIEAALVSLLEPGDPIVVLSAGRFGLLLKEIAERCGAEVTVVEAEWGQAINAARVEAAVARVRPRLVAAVYGDTSTTIAQPLEEIGRICARHGALLYVDATATIGGMNVPVDEWGADIVTAGLQKCLGGPSGSAPITISDRAADRIFARRHVEQGIASGSDRPATGRRITSNYFDLAMIMDYWSERRLNHHTEATTMLYGARECARLVLEEGLPARFERHRVHGAAMATGLKAMGLTLFGDQAYKMANVVGIEIPQGVDGERVRTAMRTEFQIEIGSSFGPLAGRIWRIGTMGYNCRRDAVLITLSALEAVLRAERVKVPSGEAVDAARAHFASDELSSKEMIGIANH
ncbi:MAG: pyridoxal-phosphate-dependent aminotransferase family protein [Janthinobacterium lividum]